MVRPLPPMSGLLQSDPTPLAAGVVVPVGSGLAFLGFLFIFVGRQLAISALCPCSTRVV